MKRLFTVICLFAVVGLSGCTVEIGDRDREMSEYEGKTISEAYLQNSDTAIIRFEDGTLLVIEDTGDGSLEINGQDD